MTEDVIRHKDGKLTSESDICGRHVLRRLCPALDDVMSTKWDEKWGVGVSICLVTLKVLLSITMFFGNR